MIEAVMAAVIDDLVAVAVCDMPVAAILIGTAAALTTVQYAPTGACPAPMPLLSGSMYSCTLFTRVESAGCLSELIMTTFTVLLPFHSPITFAHRL